MGAWLVLFSLQRGLLVTEEERGVKKFSFPLFDHCKP